jgi:hypothetical protein
MIHEISMCIIRMNVVSLNRFLHLFHDKNEKESTVNRLIATAQVRSGTKLRPLKQYMIDRHISRETIRNLCEHINNRDDYLTRFYNLSLKIDPDVLCIHDSGISPMKNREMNNNQSIIFKNVIRNIHMLDILKNTKSGIENVPT